ncbi:MAG: hypothetical protein ACXVWZ_14795 [Nocardioides sp.]
MSDDDELLARLRAVDPASALPPADPSWVARLVEDTMGNDVRTYEPPETREDGTHGRGPLTWLVAAAAVLLIAGAGIFGLVNRGGDDKVPAAGTQPSVTTLHAPAGGTTGKCMVPNARLISQQSLAFEGTVQSIAGGVVTLVPTRFYTGSATDLVKVEAPSADLQALVGAVKFEEGGRYLVAASGGQVMVCGFSGPYTADLAGLYQQAFPDAG